MYVEVRDPFENSYLFWNQDLISKLKQDAQKKPQTHKMCILFERKILIVVCVTRFEVFKSVVILVVYALSQVCGFFLIVSLIYGLFLGVRLTYEELSLLGFSIYWLVHVLLFLFVIYFKRIILGLFRLTIKTIRFLYWLLFQCLMFLYKLTIAFLNYLTDHLIP